MGGLFQYRGNKLLTGWPDPSGPVPEPARAPFADKAVCRGEMLFAGGVTILSVVPLVTGNAKVLMIDLYIVNRVKDLDLTTDISVRNAVIVFVFAQVDVTVLLHGDLIMQLNGIPFGRQRFQGWLVS